MWHIHYKLQILLLKRKLGTTGAPGSGAGAGLQFSVTYFQRAHSKGGTSFINSSI